MEKNAEEVKQVAQAAYNRIPDKIELETLGVEAVGLAQPEFLYTPTSTPIYLYPIFGYFWIKAHISQLANDVSIAKFLESTSKDHDCISHPARACVLGHSHLQPRSATSEDQRALRIQMCLDRSGLGATSEVGHP